MVSIGISVLTYFKVRWVVIDDGTANSNIDQSDVNALMVELNADFAAARIFIEEAGGRITTKGGLPLGLEKMTLIASNGRLHNSLCELIATHYQD